VPKSLVFFSLCGLHVFIEIDRVLRAKRAPARKKISQKIQDRPIFQQDAATEAMLRGVHICMVEGHDGH
jgi:hypothetical protein